LERKQQNEEIKKQVEEKIASQKDSIIVFQGDAFWPVTSLGLIASKICYIYQKPTFIYNFGEKKSVGSVRTPRGINSVKAMENCSQYLKTYGGHPLAAGFTVPNENLEKFEKCLIKYFEAGI